MQIRLKKAGAVLILALLIALLFAAPCAAAITGFVAKDSSGGYHQYSYSDLLDAYAIKILGQPSSLYDDFASKSPFAVLSSAGGYIEYASILDYYALTLLNNRKLDLNSFITGVDAKKAAMPQTVKMVTIVSGNLVRTDQPVSPGGDRPAGEADGPKIKIAGQAEVTLQDAIRWATDRGAAPRFIDVAPIYWQYGELTGIRPEVLYAQAAVTTNFGVYSGIVPASHNNWAGIHAAESSSASTKEDFQVFSSPEEGVRAHFNQVSVYLGFEPIGEPHKSYYVVLEKPFAGQVEYLHELSGTWVSTADYHTYIAALVQQLLTISAGGQSPAPGSGNNTHNNGNQPSTNPDSGQNGNSPPLPVKETVIVNVSVLNFRSGPGTDHRILFQLTRGTILEVLDKQGDWLQVIRPGGQEGWIHGDYVSVFDLSGRALAGRTVLIDPGHGGSDPGAVGITGLLEKEVNLNVSLYLAELLTQAGVNVIMTRSTDKTVSHHDRVDLANNSGADLFISIHANAFRDPESNGTETHYCAKTENSAESLFLARQLQRELVSALGMRNRGVKSNSFFVLTNTEIPAALVELGFLTNKDDEALLRDPETQKKAALALFLGLEAYFAGQ